MTVLRTLAVNSAIYTFANLLQKGAAFLLLPLYTRFLVPEDYGVLAVVTALNGFLGIFFTLGMTGAITRFFFEHRDEPEVLARFLGTAFTFILLLSALLLAILLIAGPVLLRPVIGAVAFWPYVALGMVATLFQPLFSTYLVLLQMQNDARRFFMFSLTNFVILTALTIVFVVLLRMGVLGSLLATLMTTLVFGLVALWQLRRNLRPSLDWKHLRPALAYALPLVPHSLATQSTAFFDRIVLNSVAGAAITGLYSVGAMIASVVEVAAQSVNRAYVPMTMEALKRGGQFDYEQIRNAGTLVITMFLILAASIGAFSREILAILVSADYQVASDVVPFLVLTGAVNASYLVFVNILFYERRAVHLVPLGTITGAGCSVLFTLVLVPRMGLIGAAVASVLAQGVATVVIAILARRHDPVHWPYGRLAVIFALSAAAALFLSRLAMPHPAMTIFTKLLCIGLLAILAGLVAWRAPWILFKSMHQLVCVGWFKLRRLTT